LSKQKPALQAGEHCLALDEPMNISLVTGIVLTATGIRLTVKH
jgi:hypothetical protein